MQLYIVVTTLNLFSYLFHIYLLSLYYFYFGGIVCDCLFAIHLLSYCRCLNIFVLLHRSSLTSKNFTLLHLNLLSKRVEICLHGCKWASTSIVHVITTKNGVNKINIYMCGGIQYFTIFGVNVTFNWKQSTQS